MPGAARRTGTVPAARAGLGGWRPAPRGAVSRVRGSWNQPSGGRKRGRRRRSTQRLADDRRCARGGTSMTAPASGTSVAADTGARTTAADRQATATGPAPVGRGQHRRSSPTLPRCGAVVNGRYLQLQGRRTAKRPARSPQTARGAWYGCPRRHPQIAGGSSPLPRA